MDSRTGFLGVRAKAFLGLGVRTIAFLIFAFFHLLLPSMISHVPSFDG